MKRFPEFHLFILSFFLFFFGYQLYGQERGLLLSEFYSPKDYVAGTQNWAVVQDSRGLMYFGNSSCILEYDGVSWRQIYITNQSAVRSLAVDKNNNIYAGAYNEFGILTPDNNGELQYKSLIHLIDKKYTDFGDVWNVYCINDEVFFLTEKYLFRLKNNTIDYWEKTAERFYLSFKANNKLYVLELGKGLMVFENNALKLVKKGEYFSNKRIHAIIPFEDNLLIGTRTNGLYIYENHKSTVKIKPVSQISDQGYALNQYFIENILYHGIKISDKLFALSAINGTVLTVDNNWNIIDVISNESTGIISPAHFLYFDRNQSLWLALANGISKVEIYSPFRYWTDELGIVGTISDVASLNNYTYIATGSGIYYAKKENQENPFSVSRFYPVKGTFEQSWWFLYFFIPDQHLKNEQKDIFQKLNTLKSPSSDEALLLIATSRGIFQIKKDYSKKISKYQIVLKLHQYSKDPSKVFLGLKDGIALLDYSNGQWIDLGKQFGINEQIRDINEDSLGNLWASATYKGLYQIQNPLNQNNKNHKINLHNSDKGLPSIKAVSIGRHKNQLYFVSDNNYYKYNYVKDSFLVAENFFHSDETDEEDQSFSDTISWHKVYDNMISGFYVTTFSDSIVWFGTTEGTFRYNHIFDKDYNKISPPVIRNVSTKDSVFYFGTNFIQQKNQKDTIFQKHSISTSTKTDIGTALNYKNNSLTFHFASPFYDEESKNKYKFFLEGYDKSWSDWSNETKKEYTNLREGDYTFKVKSKNLYGIESETTLFTFKILPPWYRSFAAILGYIILGILIIVGIVRLYTYRLILEKDKLEKIVIQRTQEILMQKEEILVQAEHLKDANERISAKNEELEKQKWEITNQAIQLRKANVELLKLSKVASETDNAIAVFDKDGNIEWVNNAFTKMYGYTLEQYKKERFVNISKSSDNPNIKDAIKACIKDKKSVLYEFKTKSRAGKELWAQTTLTPVVDKDGKTINLVAIDSDITQLKLAEKEILHQKKEIEEQRDKLALSNATKNKFFRIIAHDLRNPISTLVSSTNLVFNDFEDYNKAQTKNIIAELNKLSQTTFNLLENLLDWSSTQMGEVKFTPKPIEIKMIVNENIELIRRKIDQKNIELVTKIPENIIAYADEDMVKTVIRNLLSNAVKFTPENGEIEISVRSKKNEIIFTIKDSGIGIDPKDLPKLFRIDQHHTTPGLSNEKGSGLGLILCKEFVEKNEGTITIESKPQQGTSITFTLKNHNQ